jgi:TonB family protein
LHVTVSEDGDVAELSVTQSTGSLELDQACLDAIYDAPFLPARREGKPVSGITDVVLDWSLPELETKPPLLSRQPASSLGKAHVAAEEGGRPVP